MTSSVLKKPQASTRQGANRLGSGVYVRIHEHFETICNAVSCRLRLFQHAARWSVAAAALLLAACQPADEPFLEQHERIDLVIENGQVIDGLGTGRVRLT